MGWVSFVIYHLPGQGGWVKKYIVLYILNVTHEPPHHTQKFDTHLFSIKYTLQIYIYRHLDILSKTIDAPLCGNQNFAMANINIHHAHLKTQPEI